MAGKVKPIPDGYHSITPFLMVRDGARALDFYVKAFGGEVVLRMDGPDGAIMHSEVKVGDSRFMVADEMPGNPDYVCSAPASLGGSSAGLMFYVPDVDQAFRRALDAGAKERRPLQDQFYGDRTATVEDPFGHCWTLATHIEDVSPEEMDKRLESLMKG